VPVDHRLERQAKNEALTRTVNQQRAALDEGAGWAEPEHLFEFVCECGNGTGCESRVEMTLAEYERVREQDDRFAVAPGHENDAIETVVERQERFVIVDKRDAYEPLVEQ
jgi:hypothetical protein